MRQKILILKAEDFYAINKEQIFYLSKFFDTIIMCEYDLLTYTQHIYGPALFARKKTYNEYYLYSTQFIFPVWKNENYQ